MWISGEMFVPAKSQSLPTNFLLSTSSSATYVVIKTKMDLFYQLLATLLSSPAAKYFSLKYTSFCPSEKSISHISCLQQPQQQRDFNG